MNTTDFDEWLGEAAPEGHEEVYSLYKTVSTGEGWGSYSTTTRGQQRFVIGPGGQVLVLASAKAVKAFLAKIEDEYKDDKELDMESWYGLQRTMASDNS